jgi:hypothetical protein
MAGTYQWLTLSQAIAQLAQRLNDPNNTFWTQAELTVYIQQGLRIFNSLTWTWRKDFQFTSTSLWNSLVSLSGSPRLRSVTDTYCYTELEYMLLEPATGGTWTGTNQFSISALSNALEGTRDDILQVANCNQSLLTGIALTPNTIRTLLPDTVIDVTRVRYMALDASTSGTAALGANSIAVGSTAGINVGDFVSGVNINYWAQVTAIGTGTVSISMVTTGIVSGTVKFYNPTVLYRDDTVAQEFYEAPLYQLAAGTPQTFSLSSEPPLSWDVDVPPDQAGVYEAVVLQSGTAFAPPAATILGIPDDFAWVAEWGALAELLGSEAEATDRERASYAQKMYQQGLDLMQKTPWIELGKVNGAAVSLDSIYAVDRYDVNWDASPSSFGPTIVVGGIDFIAAPIGQGIGVTVLANAPVPSVGTDYVQASRSNWDTILDLCQARCLFKVGGAEWQAGLELEKRAIEACAAENSRLRSQGCFSDILDQRGLQEERDRNRYNSANGKKQ